MSDEIRPKEKTFEFPMMPIFGVDLGERLGELAAGQKQMRADAQKLDARMDKLDAKMDIVEARLTGKIEAVDGRVDKCLVAINRMDERMNAMESDLGGRLNSTRTMIIGLYVAVAAGIILQFFFK